jgi:hypothetical protein
LPEELAPDVTQKLSTQTRFLSQSDDRAHDSPAALGLRVGAAGLLSSLQPAIADAAAIAAPTK